MTAIGASNGPIRPTTRAEVATDYPWDGRIRVVVRRAPEGERMLSVRIPAWCADRTCSLDDTGIHPTVEDGWLRIRREGRPDDGIVLDLVLRPRLTEPHPRVDAVRGSAPAAGGPERAVVTAVPYALWDNREPGAMRVWVPVRTTTGRD